jgi:sporulation-control protein spo0M
MFKRIKDILGIEGVKMEMLLDENFNTEPNLITGKIRFTSQSNQRIEKLTIRLIENYKRGRNDSKLINDYLLGSLELDIDIEIEKDEKREFDFKLAFHKMKSEMDRMQDKVFIVKPLIWLAKKLKNVKSTYRLEASANIKGTRLHPLVSQTVELED